MSLLHAMSDAKSEPLGAISSATGCPNAPFNIVYWRRNFFHCVSLFERPVIAQMSTATGAQMCKTCFGKHLFSGALFTCACTRLRAWLCDRYNWHAFIAPALLWT